MLNNKNKLWLKLCQDQGKVQVEEDTMILD